MSMRSFLYVAIPVFATSVFSYCLFAIVSFMGQDAAETYSFIVAFACAFASAAANFRFAFRGRSVASVAILNGALIASTEFLAFAAPNDVQGFWLHAIAAVCFAAPVIHGLLLSREPVKANTMLLYCEFSIVGTAVLVLLQTGEMQVPASMVGISIAALVLNLFLLSALRISGPAKKPVAGRKGAERGTLLAVVLAVVVSAAVAVSVFLLPASREAVFAAAYATRDFFAFIGRGIERFFVFLVSLAPAPALPAPEAMEPGMDDGVQYEGEALAGMDPAIGIWVFLVFAAIALAAIVILVFRFRRRRLLRRATDTMVYEEEAGDGWPLLRALLALPARFRAWLLFRRCLMERRGTYEEAYLRILRAARRRGLRRAASETPRAFLYRAAAPLPGASPPVSGVAEPGSPASDAIVSEPGLAARIAALLDRISAAVDRRLYSGGDHEYALLPASETETLCQLLAAIGTRH